MRHLPGRGNTARVLPPSPPRFPARNHHLIFGRSCVQDKLIKTRQVGLAPSLSPRSIFQVQFGPHQTRPGRPCSLCTAGSTSSTSKARSKSWLRTNQRRNPHRYQRAKTSHQAWNQTVHALWCSIIARLLNNSVRLYPRARGYVRVRVYKCGHR